MMETGMMVDDKGQLLYTFTFSKADFYDEFGCSYCPICELRNDTDEVFCKHCQNKLTINTDE